MDEELSSLKSRIELAKLISLETIVEFVLTRTREGQIGLAQVGLNPTKLDLGQ